MNFKLTVYSVLICISLNANAIIIDNGIYTTDTATGFDWLDVTETLNMPQTLVSAEILSGTLNGWRYATGAEFDELVSNFGIAPQNNTCINGGAYCDLLGGEIVQIENFVNLLGDTRLPSNSGGQNFISGITRGILSDTDDSRPFPYYWSALVSDYDFERNYAPGDIIYGEDYIVTHTSSGYEGDSPTFGGSFLVRQIPEPSTLLLLAPSLLGLFLYKKINTSITSSLSGRKKHAA